MDEVDKLSSLQLTLAGNRADDKVGHGEIALEVAGPGGTQSTVPLDREVYGAVCAGNNAVWIVGLPHYLFAQGAAVGWIVDRNR